MALCDVRRAGVRTNELALFCVVAFVDTNCGKEQ